MFTMPQWFDVKKFPTRQVIVSMPPREAIAVFASYLVRAGFHPGCQSVVDQLQAEASTWSLGVFEMGTAAIFAPRELLDDFFPLARFFSRRPDELQYTRVAVAARPLDSRASELIAAQQTATVGSAHPTEPIVRAAFDKAITDLSARGVLIDATDSLKLNRVSERCPVNLRRYRQLVKAAKA